MIGQTLRGLVAQGMDGRKASALAFAANYPEGTWTFTPTYSGRHKFVLWGGGGHGDATKGAYSGGYSEFTTHLAVGQRVTIVVGATAADTTATFPSGKVVTASAGALSVAGAGSGGVVNLSGSAGGTSATGTAGLGTGGGAAGFFGNSVGSGGGAPANLPFRGGVGGGDGAIADTGTGRTPGGGGTGTGAGGYAGGQGACVVLLVST